MLLRQNVRAFTLCIMFRRARSQQRLARRGRRGWQPQPRQAMLIRASGNLSPLWQTIAQPLRPILGPHQSPTRRRLVLPQMRQPQTPLVECLRSSLRDGYSGAASRTTQLSHRLPALVVAWGPWTSTHHRRPAPGWHAPRHAAWPGLCRAVESLQRPPWPTRTPLASRCRHAQSCARGATQHRPACLGMWRSRKPAYRGTSTPSR